MGVPTFDRLFRIFMTTVLALCLLMVSYVMIFEARYVADLYSTKSFNLHCDAYGVLVDYNSSRLTLNPQLQRPIQIPSNIITYADVQFDEYWKYYNKTDYGSHGYLLCYCEQIDFDKGYTAMNSYEFLDPDTGETVQSCYNLHSNNLESTGITYLATFIVVGINLILSVALRALVKFESWGSYTAEIMSLSIKLFVAQYANTGLLSLIIYGSLSRLGGSSIQFQTSNIYRFGIFNGDVTDFDYKWYFSIGSSIVFTMCIYAFSGSFSDSLYVLGNWFSREWDQRTGNLFPLFDPRITHCDVQSELDRLYLGTEFPIEYVFASILTIVFVNMTYSPGMPVLNIIIMLSLIVQYIGNKVRSYHGCGPCLIFLCSGFLFDMIKVRKLTEEPCLF